MLRHKIYLFPIIMLGATVSSGIIAAMSTASADDISPIDDEITITVDSACTMGQTTLSSNPTLNPGETNTIGTSRIAAYCNDANGYDIYAIGYTNGEYGNTAMQSADGDYTISTGTSGTASYWNMRLAPGTATGSTSYIPTVENAFLANTTIPDDYTKVASYTSTTIPQTEDPLTYGSYIDATYQAHISTTQPAGVYTGQVQYVMVHPTGAPAPEVPPTYMQDTATIKRKLINVGDTMQAIDKRDGKEYWITKLADGNIWMTQNLDLCIGCEGTAMLTSKNTDLNVSGSGAYSSGYSNDGGIITWSPDSTAITSDRVISGASVSEWRDNNYNPYSAESYDTYVYTPTSTSGSTVYTTLGQCIDAGNSEEDCAHHHVGNYYNWSAAIASNSSNSISSNYTIAANSICPAGWRLPKGRSSYTDTPSTREFGQLLYVSGVTSSINARYYTANGFAILRNSPLFFISGGYVNNSKLNSRGEHGDYWSSTVANSGGAYYIYTSTGDIDSGAGWTRSDGNSVRCLIR